MNADKRFTMVESPIGCLLLEATDRGICRVQLGKESRVAPADAFRDDAGLRPWAEEILAFVTGRATRFTAPLDIQGTPFQMRVWKELMKIPYGETRSYSAIARAIGKPRAMRAVGSACGANPVALLIPCHRVIREDGSLGGFGWGLERKVALLKRERENTAD